MKGGFMTLTPCDFDPGLVADDPRVARYTLAQQVFPFAPASVRDAREMVRQALSEHGQHCLVGMALQVVSELVTNSIVHGIGAEFTLTVKRLGFRTVYIDVAGRSEGRPTLRSNDLSAEGGRGLLLVDLLAQRWGWRMDEDDGLLHTWCLLDGSQALAA